jgi:hypothetical protein
MFCCFLSESALKLNIYFGQNNKHFLDVGGDLEKQCYIRIVGDDLDKQC